MKLTYRPCPSCGTTYPLPDSARRCYWCRQGYAAALRDAVEAVKALPVDGLYVQSEPYETAIHQVVTAIEALGGER